MTTPETARTAEPTTEQVSAYRDYLHYSHPHGRFTYDENAAVLAAIAFVRSCFPPQASTGREWERECKIDTDHEGTTVSDGSSSWWLTPRGWVHDSKWIDMPIGPDRFPTESAAFSALAKAPRPTP